MFHAINRFQTSTRWAHAPLRVYAVLGIGIFAVLLVAAWWIGRRGRPVLVAASVSAGLASLVALAANQLIGRAVDRARPYPTHGGVHLLVSRTSDFSFPSDHAAVAGAVAVGLLLVDRRLGLVAAVAAVLMAFARVYAGAHYPGDVVAGLAVGATTAALLHFLLRQAGPRVVDTVAGTPLAPLVATTAASRR